MPNDQKPIKPNTARKQAPRKQDFNNTPLKKAGDGTMGFMLWSMAGTVIAACSSPIFSDVADLAGGGGGGDTQGGPRDGAVVNGLWANTDIYVADEDGNIPQGANAVGITDGAGNLIFNDNYTAPGNGERYLANLEGATEVSTETAGSGELLSLPYHGGYLLISPLTDLLTNALNGASTEEVANAGGEDAFQQNTLDDIFGMRPQFDDDGNAIADTEDSIVTVEDVLNADNYNPYVNDNRVTKLVSLASTTLSVIETEASSSDTDQRVVAIVDSFNTIRGQVETQSDEAMLDEMLLVPNLGLADTSIGGIDLDERVEVRLDQVESRPLVATPNRGEAIRMTEGDQEFALVRGNAEVLFGFDDPYGNSDSPDDEDDVREDGQLVGIYIEAASTDNNINVMFRNDDDDIVGLADADPAQRDTTDGEPGPRNVGGATFFYVSLDRLERLVLRPADEEFNTNPDDPDANPKIRFYVYDGEDATLANDADATILAALVGELEIEVVGVNDVPEITSQTTPAPITSNTGSASGTFQVSDADGDTDFTWVATGPTTYGTIDFADTNGTDRSGNGAWEFRLNAEAFDRIPNGTTETVTFNITATDLSGGVSDPVSVVIMLQGQSDGLPMTPTANAPVLGEVTSPPAVKTATEAGHELASGVTVATPSIAAMGSLTHTDDDAGQGDFVGGTVHIKADGVGDGDPAAANAAYAAGVGSNTGNQIDGTDRGTAVAGTYGTIYLRADGNWYYVLDDANADINALPDGVSTLMDVFNVRIQETADSTAVSNVLDLTIAITGKDDAPTDIQATLVGGSEAVADNALVATYNGNAPMADMVVASLTTTDPDSTTPYTYTIETGSTDASSFRIGGANNDQLLFASSVTEADNRNPGETWSVGVISTDSDGLSRTEPFTITRAGNAFPVFSASITNYDSANSLITAQVNDPDSTQSEDAPMATGTLIATDFEAADADIRYSAMRAEGETNDYGRITFDPANPNQWTFTLTTSADVAGGNDGVTVLNALASATATATMNFTVTADDGAGGTATATLTVTLRGAPDSTVTRPTIDTNSDLEDTITDADARNHEDIPSAVSGNIALTAGDTVGLMWSVAAASVSGRPADVPDGTDFGTLTFPNSPSFTSFGTAFSGTSPLGWTFTPTDAINLLDDGETVVLRYDITAMNPGGDSMVQTLMINLEGMTNSVPLIDSTSISDTQMVPDTDAAPDNTFAALTGTFTAGTSTVTKWSHAAQASSVSDNTYGTDFGTFSFDNAAAATGGGLDRGESRDGAWRFIPNADLINRIPHGETVTFAYRITATNDAGASMAGGQDFMFSFTGTNDEPVLAVTGNNAGVTEAGGANNAVAGTASAIGGFTITDPDVHSGANQNSFLFGGNMLQGRSGSTGAFTNAVDGPIRGTYGTLTVEGDGSWTYTLDNTDSATQELRGATGSTAAQTVQDVFEIRLENVDAGNTQTSNVATLMIEVTGANDNPMITDTSGVILEVSITDMDTASDNTPPTVNQDSDNPASSSEYGSFAATDLDTGDTIRWSTDGVGTINPSMTHDDFDLSTADFGTPTVNPEGTWSFAPTARINDLNAGQSIVIDYTIQATDGSGGTDTSILRVRLTGTTNDIPNRDPMITDTGGVIFNVVVEDPMGSSTNIPPAVNQSSDNPATSSEYGSFAATDPDTGDTIIWSMTDSMINTVMTTFAVGSRPASDFGALTVDDVGTWSFAPTVAINDLNAGQSVVIDYTIQADDGAGGTDTSILRVTLQGRANDIPNRDPVIDITTGIFSTGIIITDDNPLPTNDPDAVNHETMPTVGGSAYGSFTATDPDVGDNITWAPATPLQGSPLVATGTIDSTGPSSIADTAPNLANPGSRTAAEFGVLMVNADGTWSFDPTDAINHIADTEYVVLKYDIEADDGNGGTDTETLTVRLNGVDNVAPAPAPVFSGVSEDTHTFTDPDPASNNDDPADVQRSILVTNPEQLMWSVAAPVVDGDTTEDAAHFGTLTFPNSPSFTSFGTAFDGLASLTWNFDPNTGINDLDSGDSVTLTYVVTATNRGGASTDTNLVITLNGAQDGRVTFDNPGITLAEDTDLSARLKVADIMVDAQGGTPELDTSMGDFDKFDVDGNVLYLNAGANINHDAPDGITSLNVRVQLQGEETVGNDFTITITDVNDEDPVFNAGNPAPPYFEFMRVGNHGDGVSIYTASATPDVAGDTITWSLKNDEDDEDNNDAGRGATDLFEITSEGKVIIPSGRILELDYETRPVYTAVIVAEVGGLMAEEKVTVLTVRNVADIAPTIYTRGNVDTSDDRLSPQSENEALQKPFYTVSAEFDTSVQWSLTGQDAGLFDITPIAPEDLNADQTATGRSYADITAKSTGPGPDDFITLDQEARLDSNGNPMNVLFTVVATSGSFTDTLTIEFEVIDENDEAPVITSGSGDALPAGTEIPDDEVVYTATGTRDTVNIVWSLTGADAGLFNINSGTGEVTFKTATTPDVAVKDSYSFTVVATSGILDAVEQPVTFAVLGPAASIDVVSAGNDGTDGFFVFKTESEVYNRIDVILALQNLPPRTTVPTTVFEGGNVVFVRIGGQLEFDSSSGNYNPVYHDSDEILQVINDAIRAGSITHLSSAEAHPDQGADAFTVTQSRGIHVRPSNRFAIAEDTDISSGIQGGTVFYKVADIALLDINSNSGAFGDIEIDPTSQDADKFMLVHTALVERDGMGDVIRDNEGNLPQGPSDLALYLKPDADLNHEDGDGVLEVTVHIVGDDTISADISVVVTNVADEGPASFDVASNGNYKTAVLGDELTVSLETHDPDGASTLTTYDDIAYQWLRDGVEIAGETSDSYTVTSDDVDDELTVVVTYTDPEGNSEEVTTLGVAAPLAVEYFPVAHNVETNIEIFQFTTENQEQVLVNFALQVPPVPERNGLILSRPTVVVEDTETNVVTVQIGLDSNLPHTFAHIFDVINTEINEGNITLLSSAGLSPVAGLSPDDSASLLNSFFPESIGQQSYLRVTSPRTDTSDPVYTTMPPYVTEDFSGRESGQDAGVIPSFQVIVNSKGQSNFIPENTDTSARIKIADFVVADPTESRNIQKFSVDGDTVSFESFEIVNESRVVPTDFEVRDHRIVITATETVYLRSIYLKAGTELDHETKDTLSVRGELDGDEVVVTVYVTDVNEGSASFNVTSNGNINTPVVDDVLTAALDPSSSDPEGAGGNITYSYQWQRDGVTISNPTQTADMNQDGASYTITEADEGHTLRAFTVYIDGGGYREFVLTNEVVVPVATDDLATEITAESYPIEDESLFVEGEGTDTFFVFKTESFTPVTVNIHIDDVEDIFADNTDNSNKEVFTVPTTVAQINDNQVDIYVGGILFNPNSGTRNIVHHDLNHILAVINSAIDEGRITLLTSAELRPYDYVPPAEPLVSTLYYFPGIGLDNQVTSLAEDADVSSRIKIADIAITSHQGPLELVGRDAGKFEIDGTVLYLRQNTDLDYDIPDNTLSVRVQVTPPAPAEPIGVDVAVTITNVDEGDAIFSVMASGSGSDINAPAVGDVLSVSVTAPADPDGGIDGGFHYQWQRSDADGNNYVDIAAATGNSYVLATDDEGTNLRVVVRYTDVGGTSEIVVKSVASFRASGDNPATAIALSDTTTTLAEDADVSSYRKVADIDITDVGGGLAGTLQVVGRNPEKFEIFGTALYLRPHAILDHESDIELEVSVQLRENTGISSSPLTIGITNVDEGDARFNITSNADINAPVVGNMLTVAPDSTNPDPDGNGNNTFIYQWQRVDDNGDVTDILDENNATYTVTSSDEDHTLRVGVKYTDGGNTAEDIRTSGVFVPSTSTPALPIPIPEGRNLLGDYIPINHEDFTATPEEMRLDDTQKININSAGIAEGADTSARIKVADIVIRDDDGGLAGTLELAGADSDHFELDGNVLYLSSGIDLGMEAMDNDPLLEVRVQLNEDTSIGDDITIAILPDVV